MSDTEVLTPLEEAAFPFLQHAVLLDQARGALAILDKALVQNAELWLRLSEHTVVNGADLSLEAIDFVNRTATFTAKAAKILEGEMDNALIDKLIALNLNMSEVILKGGAPTEG